MDFLGWFLAFFVGGAILYGLQSMAVTSPGRQLASRFKNLGDMTGMEKSRIISMVGEPTSVSELPEGKVLLQWQATGYHIAIRFSGEVFDGITHEHSAD